MLRSIFLKSLRDQRTSALAWGAGFGALAVLIAAAWVHAYPDEASRATLAEQVKSGLSIAEVLYGQPHHIDRLPGWIEWRAIGLLPVLLGMIAVLTATRITRGAEEDGTLESIVATASCRTRAFAEQAASVLAGLAVICGLIWLGMLAAGPVAGENAVDPLDSLLLGVNLYLVVAFAVGLGLVAGHFTTSRRAAALTAGGAVVAMHIWDNLTAITPAIRDARPLSPFYLYSASAPLSEGRVNVAAIAGMGLLAAGVVILACWLVDRRDLRGVVKLPWQKSGERVDPTAITAGYFRPELGLRSPFFRGLVDSRTSIAAWGMGLALLSALFAAVTPGIREVWAQRASSSGLSQLIGTDKITDNAVVSFAVFGFLQLLVSIFALTLAAAWASEEMDGRLELEVACPVPRAAIFLQRFGASISAAVVVIGLAGAGLMVAAVTAGVDLNWTDAVVALVLLLPLSAVVIAFGYFVSSTYPRLVVGAGATILLISYFIEILVPLFGWPNELQYLSVFHLYGRPLLDGPDWPSAGALVAATLVLGAAGSHRFTRRDIAR
jgi:ABC-2 type transport system permease protein